MKAERYNRPEKSETVNARPHNVSASMSSARVILTIKNWSTIPGVCHIGLGVTAMCTVKVLRRAGINAEAWSTQNYAELNARIKKDQADGGLPITHVVISAPS